MASISWKTGTSGSWTTGPNWNTGSAPSAGDDVLIAASGSYSISAGSAISIRSITISGAGATLSPSSTLNLAGVLSLTAGTYALNGSTINGGTISVAGGTFQVTRGTLSAVSYQGALSLAAASASLTVVGGISLSQASGSGAGTINLTGASATLALADTQVLDGATINIGSSSSGSPAKLVEKDVFGTGGTLTLGPSLTVRANGGYGFLQAASTTAVTGLVNAGTIGFTSSGGLIAISANRFINSGQMTVTGGGTLDVLTGPYGVATGAVGSNSGTIAISSGLLAFANSFTNTGSVVATGGTVTIAGTFVTTGAFTANNTKLTIGGTISGASLLALLNNSSDTVTYTATYENSGAVLNIGSGTTIGTLTLGTSLPIRNGTIADAGGGFVFNAGTLTNVTYQGTVDLSRNGSVLNIATKLVNKGAGGSGLGAIKLTGTSSYLNLIGSQTLDTAIVTLGSSVRTSSARITERDSAGTGTTLTLGSSLQIVSNGGFGAITSVGTLAPDALVNRGTVQVATGGGVIQLSADQFTNSGKLLVSAGGTLGVLSGPYTVPAAAVGTNTGSISSAGGVLLFGASFTNTGSISVNGGTLTLAGTFDDAGALSVNNATVNLGGVFGGQSFLRLLNNSTDTVTVTGTYDNSGDTLYVGSGTTLGTINLASGLPISGGTIVDTGGGLIYAGGTLDGVTYVGTLSLGGSDVLDVLDGLIVRNSGGSGPGIVNLTGGYSQINFLNGQTVDGLTITMGDASQATDSLYNFAAGTVALGAGVRVQQITGVAQIYSYAPATTVNQGRISVGGDGLFQIYGNGGGFINSGTISVSGTGTLAVSAFLGDTQFTNAGVLIATGSSDVTLEAGWSNTGTISVTGATLKLGSDTTSGWQSIGTITASNATLELGGAFTTAQLAQIGLSNTDTRIFGALDNTSTILAIGGAAALGTITLAGGTVTGGTISDAGGGLVFADGTLDGVTYRGALTIGQDGNAWVVNGLTLRPSSGSGAGTINITGGGSGLFILDTETLDNATITMGDASGETDYIQNYVFPGPGTLTLGAGLLIQQSVGDAAIYTAASGTTISNARITVTGGTFHVDYGTFVNSGTISATGATAVFDDNVVDFTNSGLISATSGGDIALQAGWDNTGTINISGGGHLQLGSDASTAWGTIGTINATNATLDLYGAFTTAQLLSLSLSGDVANVFGALNNAGGTLSIANGGGLAALGPAAGGVIRGGVIVDAGGGFVAGGGTLDGVTYRGVLAISPSGSLNVQNGLTLQAASGGGAGTLALTGGGSSLVVLDTETLDNATIRIGDASGVTDILSNGGANGNTLTLGANILLQQTTGQAQILSSGSNDVTVNQGLIAVSGGTLDVSGGTFTNNGTITVTGGGAVTFEPNSLGNATGGVLSGGVYAVGSGSTLELERSSNVSVLNADVTETGSSAVVQWLNGSGVETALDSNVRTIGVTGALRLLSGRSLAIPGAFLNQGVLQLAGGTLSTSSTLTVAGTLSGFGSIVGGLSATGLVEANDGLLKIVNITSGSGQLQIDSDGTLELVTNSGLSSTFNGAGGTLLLDKPSTYTGSIAGFALGDSIVLGGITASAVAIANNVLSVNLTNGGTLTYSVSGSFTGLRVQAAAVNGDTVITLASAAPTQITSLLDNRGRTLSVGNGTTYDLAGGTVWGGTISDAGGGFDIGYGTFDDVTYRGTLIVDGSGVLNVVNGLIVRTVSGGLPGAISLAGGGSILQVLDTETLDNAVVTIGDSSGSIDILGSAGAAANTLTLGAGLTVRQTVGQAQLLNGGTSDAIINRGSIAVAGGTLDISGGSFSNSGTISVSGGGTLMFEPATLTNFASNTLTGGVWTVGAGSTIQLARSTFIYTLNADVTLSGTGSVIQSLNSSNVQNSLDGSLRTIGASGALRVLGGRSLALKGTVSDQGLLQLGGGTLSNTSVTTISGTLLGYGTAVGGITNNGVIEANGGRLTIVNIATGTGRLQVDAGATLDLATTNAMNSGFSGVGGTLQLDKPTTYTGTIGGFAVGDTIVLGGVTANSASITGGTLTVNLNTGKTLSYAVTGSFSGLTVQTASVAGNTNVTLSSGSGLRVAAASAPVATPIQASNLSLATAGFLDASGHLAGRAVVAGPSAQTLSGDAATRDIFTGTAAGLNGDWIAQFGGTGVAADVIDVTDLSFVSAVASIASSAKGSALTYGDGHHTFSLGLAGSVPASHLMLMSNQHGGTLIVHH